MQNETGHVKNVANLKSLITYLESLGPKYMPSKPSLQLPALKNLVLNAGSALDNLSAAQPAYSMAVDAQEAAFAPLTKLVSKVANAFSLSVDSSGSTDTVVSLKKAISGQSGKSVSGAAAAAAAANGSTPPATRSTSQLSYDNRIKNLDELVKTIAANPQYQPNEPELKTVTLTTLVSTLQQKTEAVDTALAPVINARILRDELLYNDSTGLLDTVKDIKSYVKSVFGASGPQVDFINQLQFRRKKQQ